MISLLAAALLAGCSTMPRIVTDLNMQLPPRQTDSLMLYEDSMTVPDGAQVVGTVKVTDGGMTATWDCMYGTMLSLAMNKTIESGANALRIDRHKLPSYWSSTCHRIWGTMLLLPDSLVTTDAHTALEESEERNDATWFNYVDRSRKVRTQVTNTPKNIVKLSGGPGFIDSKFDTGRKVYNSKWGTELAVEYQHLWKTMGVGLNYVYYGTSFDEGTDVHLSFIGPSFVVSGMFSSKWRGECELGLGYASYTEKYGWQKYSESHVGIMSSLGVEYKLSKAVGLGIQLNALRLNMDKPEGVEIDKNEFYGISWGGIIGGLRFYF